MKRRSKLQRHLVKERRRDVFVYGFLSVAFVFVMIRWGVPLLGGVFLKGGDDVGEQDDGFRPQRPVLEPIAEATFSGKIRLKGLAQKDMNIKVYDTEGLAAEGESDDEGSFELMVSLNEGENDFSIYAENDKGLESDAAKITIVYDAVKPVIEISSPGEEQEFFGNDQQRVEVKGKVSEDAEVRIAGRYVQLRDREFGYAILLNEGMNEILVTATDEAGNTAEKLLRLSFSK